MGPTGWWKADSLALADGAAVSSWADSSGNGHPAAQATGSLQPVYKAAIINGKPVVRFDGVDDILKTTGFTLNRPERLFVVAYWRAGGHGGCVDGLTGNSMRFWAGSSGAVNAYAGVDPGGVTVPGGTGISHVYSAKFDGTSSEVKIDGSVLLTGDTGTGNAGGVTLGNFGAGSGDPGAVDIAEVLVFDSALSTADVLAVERYLSNKYGIAGPANPGVYANNPPLGTDGAIRGGAGVTFDGTTQRVTVPDAPNLRITGDLTLEAWIKPADRSQYMTIMWKGNSWGRPFTWQINTTSGVIYVTGDAAGTNAFSTTAPPVGVWSHVAVTIDAAGNAKFYMNGAANGTGTITRGADSGVGLGIGNIFTGTQGLKGALDEVAIYNKVLSAATLAAHAARASGEDYRRMVLSDKPVSYWRLNEASGTTAADSAGSNTGTYVGSPTLRTQGPFPAAGDTDTAVTFDSSLSQYVSVPDAPNLRITGSPLTIEAWVKPVDHSNYYMILTKGSSGTGAYEFRLDNVNGRPIFYSGATAFLATAAPSLGVWSHVAISVDGAGNGTHYLNGLPNGTGAVVWNADSGVTVRIGARQDGYYFKGGLDEVAIYNAALSAATIAKHADPHTANYRGMILADNPVSYWRLNEVNGTVAADEKGSNPGTYVGSPNLRQLGPISGDPDTAATFTVGTNQNASLGTGIPVAAPLTVEAWAKSTDTVAVMDLFNRRTNNNNINYDLISISGKMFLYWGDGTASPNISEPGSKASDGNWHHWVGTISASGVGNLYCDGALVAGPAGNTIPSSVISSVSSYIGYDFSGRQWRGSIDEVALYNKVLTAAQVAKHANPGDNDYRNMILNDGPVGYWRLGEVPGSLVAVDLAKGTPISPANVGGPPVDVLLADAEATKLTGVSAAGGPSLVDSAASAALVNAAGSATLKDET